jgi:hypothetical protein
MDPLGTYMIHPYHASPMLPNIACGSISLS